MANPIPSAPVSTAWAGADGAMAAAAGAGARTALVAGASGLVGREILQGLLADESVAAVHIVVRRNLPLQHPKLTQHIVDFAALPPLPRCDEVYLALGTTIKAAGSQAAFRAVDFDASLAVARAARAQGATRAGLVSAMGAASASRVFYSRVKGELEEAILSLGFETVVIARPSVLVGDRHVLGQPKRSGEKLALRLTALFAPLIPENYKAIEAAAVARGLLRAVPSRRGRVVLLSGELRRQ
jgi:uncharacterized protein YbjT (DUF2867 family)